MLLFACFFPKLPVTGGRLGGKGPGGGTGGLRLTGGGLRIGGGGGSPGGGGPSTTGGCAGKGRMPGRFTSSTTTGSLPWSKGHISPLIQKPFSETSKTKRIFFSIQELYVQLQEKLQNTEIEKLKKNIYLTDGQLQNVKLRTGGEACCN